MKNFRFILFLLLALIPVILAVIEKFSAKKTGNNYTAMVERAEKAREAKLVKSLTREQQPAETSLQNEN